MLSANHSEPINFPDLNYSSIRTKHTIDASEENAYNPLKYFQLPSHTSCNISNQTSNIESDQIMNSLSTHIASLDDSTNSFEILNPDEALDDYFVHIFAPSKQSSTHSKRKNQSVEPLKTKRRVKRKSRASNDRFRPYQKDKWNERFNELLEYQRKHNNCFVPHSYATNPELARWTKRQRYQYNRLQQGRQSSMTKERIKFLNDIGFVWNSHEATWREKLLELIEYKKQYGNCLVPSMFDQNIQLATWVKCQRRQYKLYKTGRPSNISLDRILELEKYDFQWELRGSTSNVVTDLPTNDQKYNFLFESSSELSEEISNAIIDNSAKKLQDSSSDNSHIDILMSILTDLSDNENSGSLNPLYSDE